MTIKGPVRYNWFALHVCILKIIIWFYLFLKCKAINFCLFPTACLFEISIQIWIFLKCRANVSGSPSRVGHSSSRSANVTPTSTPSPKKRQLPQIPLQAQVASRDRGKSSSCRTSGIKVKMSHCKFSVIWDTFLIMISMDWGWPMFYENTDETPSDTGQDKVKLRLTLGWGWPRFPIDFFVK